MGLPVSKLALCDAPPLPTLPPVPEGSPVPPPEEKPELVQQAEDIMRGTIESPGTYDTVHNDVKRLVSLDAFDGARFEINKGINPQFSVSHSFMLGTSLIPGGTLYQFGATVFPSQKTLMMGRIDAMGRLDARVHHQVNERILTRISANLSNEPDQQQGGMEAEYRGDTWTGQFKGTNEMCTLSYLQSVTPTVALGGEAIYLASRHMALTSYVAKYHTKPFDGILTYSHGTVQAHYIRRLSDRVNLGAELAASWKNRESTAALGAEFNLRQSRFCTTVDGTGKINSVLELKVQPGISVNLTADVDQIKGSYKFGYGMTLGG